MKRLGFFTRQPLSGISGYAVALGMVGGAFLIRLLLDPFLGEASPYLLFFLAAVLVVNLTGPGPSVIAVAVSALLADWFFIEPRHQFGFRHVAEWMNCFFFAVAAVIAGYFAAATRAAWARERAAAEEAFKLKHRLETLLAALPAGVLFSEDPECREVHANPSALTQYELAPQEVSDAIVIGQPTAGKVRLFQNGRELLPAELPLQRSIAEKAIIGPVELEVELHSGKRWFTEVIAAPLLDEKGVATGGVALSFDITERKQAEEALRRQQEQLRLAHQRLTLHMENSPMAVIEFDPSLRLIFWSRGATEIFGWEAHEVIGKSMWELPWVFEEDRPQVELVSAEMLNAARARTVSPNRNRRKDGSVVWCEWYNSSLTDEHGKMLSILSLVLEVTERKRAEASLQESERRFRVMADGTTVMIWVHDAQGNLQFVNRAWQSFFGVSLEQTRGPEWRPLVHPEDAASYTSLFNECNREQKTFQARARVRRHDGQWRWVDSHGEPRFSATGEFLGLAGNSVDVTERVDFMAELERQVEQRTLALQETTDQLNSFCYSIAHDLKAPLRAQLSFATILIKEFGEALGPVGRAHAQRIIDSADRQARLILDLLAHLSVSRTDLPMSPTALRQAVDQALAELAPEIAQKRAAVEVGEIHDAVVANEGSLHIVLTNLLSNALKFVPRGRDPHVKLWTEQRGDRVRIWVQDNGIGIEPRYYGKLFQVFQRLHSTAVYPGTGIGLAIVKKAIQRMEGAVGFESEPGVGSRFWVELNMANAIAQATVARSEVS